ncbi:MAG: DUF6600 domain-containing protein [Ignavibacteriaceae bacterium]
MKKIFLIAVFLVAGLAFQVNINAQVPGRFGFFYTNLAPYGSWIELNYGVNVWRPNIMQRDWSPYQDGQWIWTNDGWYWDSYEPFGWITYHYGRWYYDDYYGWIWVPDDQWAPAWVEWRYDNDYIGWAPLPPYANFSISMGIHFSINFITPYSHWHFVRYNHFCNPHISNYYIGHTYVNNFFSRTKYRTNYGFQDGRVVNRGVDIDVVRRRSGQNIQTRQIRAVSNPSELRNSNGSRNEVRSFIGSRDEISRGDTRSIQIRKAERNSTLETSRMDIGRSRDINREETINRNNENRSVTKESVPRVIGRDNGTQNRNVQRETNPPVTQPGNNGIDRRTVNGIQNNKETTRETRPNYTPQRIERSNAVKRESAPQQRVEKRSTGNERNSNATNGSRERRR